MQRLVRIVQKKWGGKPKVLTDTQPDIGGPLDCQEGDVVIFAVRAH